MDKKDYVEETKNCMECGSSDLQTDAARGEIVCETCGLVIDEALIDQGPEWRAFDSEQNNQRARTGRPMSVTMHDKGLTTAISWSNTDAQGNTISAKNRAQMYRLRKWQDRIRISNATERNLSAALAEMDRMGSQMGASRNVRETAAIIYRKAVNKNLIRGRSIDGVAAASLYASCRQCGFPRTLDEIADISRVSRKELGRTYRFLTKELGIKIPPTQPEDYLKRFCNQLDLRHETEEHAKGILKQTREAELTSGRGPTGLAAAAIYIACVQKNDLRTQKQIAEVSGVTEVTIRNRYKEIKTKLNLDKETEETEE